MLPFRDTVPAPAGDWRHIVRFGRNVASYKFALGRTLLDLAARQQTFVRCRIWRSPMRRPCASTWLLNGVLAKISREPG